MDVKTLLAALTAARADEQDALEQFGGGGRVMLEDGGMLVLDARRGRVRVMSAKGRAKLRRNGRALHA